MCNVRYKNVSLVESVKRRIHMAREGCLSRFFCLVDGAKLRESFSSGFGDEPPSKESCHSTHTSVEEEDGRKSKMQDHVGDHLDEGKDGDAPWTRNEEE